MAGQGVTEFWEVGAGKALSGMIRRIEKDATTRAIGTAEDVARLRRRVLRQEDHNGKRGKACSI